MLTEVNKGSIYSVTYGEGKPIVILHPLATDHRSMEAWLEPIFEIHKGFKRIYVDIPAHGKSLINEEVNTTEEILSMIDEFLKGTLGNTPFLIIAMSFGSYLAQGLLSKFGEQVDGLSLLAPVTQTMEREVPNRVILEKDEEIFKDLDDEIGKAFDILIAKQNKENLELFLREFQPGRLLANRKFLASEWRTKGYHYSFELYPDGRKFEQNTLILTGKQDYICGYKDPFKLVDNFPNSTYTILNNTGHLIQIEQRKQVQYHVGEWLKNFK
ncbi:alpha/beta hydrolase [Bacillus sp. 31A1R]|uniref:Alpha/beta hydrolase n=1 Tax=Robertmurraya mangrovi TaxID=3098077 RepID=A0ABU5J306_9BACI|nr:alpha/beta hydrolase [Bacillus sp. 31A1R]MDZ5473741.1 alpha/beta hydrolase [Bacillus sp. 31A1R]